MVLIFQHRKKSNLEMNGFNANMCRVLSLLTQGLRNASDLTCLLMFY